MENLLLQQIQEKTGIDVSEFHNSFPVQICALAEKIGLTVQFDEKKNYGSLDRVNKIIHVNDKCSASENMFTVAHEIAHYILHDKDVQHRLENEKDYTNLKDEREANDFATKLLMPEDKFIAKFRELQPSKRLEKLSDHFGLSVIAIASRAFSLGLYDAL